MKLFRGMLTVSGRKLNRFRQGLRFRGERRVGAAGDLALSGCEEEQEKGPLRWEFRSRPAVPAAGRRRPAVSGRDGEAVGEPAFSPGPENKSSGKPYLPEDEKTVRKIPCFKGRVLLPGRAVHDSLVAHIPAAAQGRVQGNQRAGMLVIIL